LPVPLDILLDPPQGLHRWDLRQPGLAGRLVNRPQQRAPLGPNGGRQFLTRRVGLRQGVVLNPPGVALVPLGRRHHRHLFQGRPQGFPDALETVETAHGREHVRGIGPLTATRLDQSKIA
jgi:hypothetical protein